MVPCISFAEAPISVYINGQKQSYTQPPIIKNNSTLVPLRGIFESLGSTVDWNGSTRTVTAVKENTKVILSIGSTNPTINGIEKSISTPAQIINSSTMVPLRFVSEALGAKVNWDGAARSVVISANGVQISTPAVSNGVAATIVSVTDGDTVKINLNGKTETVRLLLVDTPETVSPTKPVQPFGKDASDFTKSMLQEGKSVEIEYDGPKRDKYDRLLAYLWVDGKIFNQTLLEKGLARVAYIYDPPYTHYDELLKAENKAKTNKLGIWSIPGYVTEDGFNSDSSTTEQPKQEIPQQQKPNTNTGVYSGPYDPFGEDRNCSDFKTQAEAQAFFIAAGGPTKDPHRLDGDGNGLVCESLR